MSCFSVDTSINVNLIDYDYASRNDQEFDCEVASRLADFTTDSVLENFPTRSKASANQSTLSNSSPTRYSNSKVSTNTSKSIITIVYKKKGISNLFFYNLC